MMFKDSIIGRAAVTLGIFGIIGAGLVALTFLVTADRIAENERQALLKSLKEVVRVEYDNKIEEDTLKNVFNEELLGPDPITIYRVRKAGQPVAAVMTPVAPDGYSGKIRMLVGVDYQGVIMGVRVVAHNETPGLGDKVEEKRDKRPKGKKWIDGFNGCSLIDLNGCAVENLNKAKIKADEGWAVKKDGGIFDQFTGATITPRAVVKATHKSLKFYTENRDKIFGDTAQ